MERLEIVFIDGNDFRPLFLEIATEERHALGAELTKFPVARDVDRSDHHRVEPKPFTVEVVFSDTPLEGGDVELTVVRDAWAALEDALARHLPAVITTSVKTYGDDVDMMLTEVAATRTRRDGTTLKAQLTFGPMVPFDTELVDDPQPARARDRRQTDTGSQATTPASPKLVSIWSDLEEGALSGIQDLVGL